MNKSDAPPALPGSSDELPSTAQTVTSWLVPVLLILEIIGRATTLLDNWA
ncbi:hypothetical protein [Streptomyces sp. NPDC056544]